MSMSFFNVIWDQNFSVERSSCCYPHARRKAEARGKTTHPGNALTNCFRTKQISFAYPNVSERSPFRTKLNSHEVLNSTFNQYLRKIQKALSLITSELFAFERFAWRAGGRPEVQVSWYLANIKYLRLQTNEK